MGCVQVGTRKAQPVVVSNVEDLYFLHGIQDPRKQVEVMVCPFVCPSISLPLPFSYSSLAVLKSKDSKSQGESQLSLH